MVQHGGQSSCDVAGKAPLTMGDMTELETMESVRLIASGDRDASTTVHSLPNSSLFVRDCSDGPPITGEILSKAGAFSTVSVDDDALAELNSAIVACNSSLEARLNVVCEDGLHVMSVSAQSIATGGPFDRLIAVRDITEAVQLEAALRKSKETVLALTVGSQLGDAEALQLALRDPLTELPNRRAFDAALAEACKTGPFALCLLDMDQFKQVNDSLGHQAGDRLLREVGARLQHHTRANDFVARLGGDEFAVILAGIETETAARDAGARLISHFQTRVSLGRLDVRAQLTGGVSLGIKGAKPDEVFAAADKALHRGKWDGRGTVQSGRMDAPHLDEHETLSSVKVLLTSSKVPVMFEPVVTADGGVFGYHAVIRGQCDERSEGFDTILATAIKFGLGEELLARVTDAMLAEAARSAIPSLHIRLPATALHDPAVVERLVMLLEHGPIESRSALVDLPINAIEGTGAAAAQRLRALQVGIVLNNWDLGLRGYALAEAGMICAAQVDAYDLLPLLHTRDGQQLIAAATQTMKRHGVPVFAHNVDDRATADQLFALGLSGTQGAAFRSSRIAPTQHRKLSAA